MRSHPTKPGYITNLFYELCKSPPGSRPSSAQGGQNQPGPAAVSFTKPTAVLRVRPPGPVGPCAAATCAVALKATDSEGTVIGSGSSHVLMSQFFDSCDKAFHQLHKDELQYLNTDEEDLTRLLAICDQFLELIEGALIHYTLMRKRVCQTPQYNKKFLFHDLEKKFGKYIYLKPTYIC